MMTWYRVLAAALVWLAQPGPGLADAPAPPLGSYLGDWHGAHEVFAVDDTLLERTLTCRTTETVLGGNFIQSRIGGAVPRLEYVYFNERTELFEWVILQSGSDNDHLMVVFSGDWDAGSGTMTWRSVNFPAEVTVEDRFADDGSIRRAYASRVGGRDSLTASETETPGACPHVDEAWFAWE